KDKLLLNFIMIDQEATIYVNKKVVGKFINPYLPIIVDIAPFIDKDKNIDLIVVVKDDLDIKLPYGKQSANPGGIFYTPCSGIMHGAYLEAVNDDYISSFKIDTKNDGTVNIEALTNAKAIKYEVLFNGKVVASGKSKDNNFSFKIDNPRLWDVDNPNLYQLVLETSEKMYSYFGFREVSIKDKKICINGAPVMLKAVLDQGYYPDGIYTVASYDCYKKDIIAMRELGYNALRKHIKIESPYFYYLCDKLGMYVMQDCINNSSISFIKDTLLPTLRLQSRSDHNLHKDKESRANFLKTMEKEAKYLYNHPSIVYYTIFNEGWGQFEADKAYDAFKRIDSTRIVDATSGWFWQTKSDVDSYHIYLRRLEVKESNRPIVISEFGAYVYSVEGHVYRSGNHTAYHAYKTIEEYKKAYEYLYDNQVAPLLDKISGYVYTQLSDVEEEANGLLTYDRKVNKIKDL
ncbi:MAG: glycoside hydrolase family 2, partial [Bacilli bacterium]|nr:glycoside hydrolase family 2 [Bacilli bacterium]